MIKYAITDPKYYSLKYLKSLHNRADFVLLRDKESKNYTKLAKEFIETTKDFNYKKIIHQDFLLAKELNAYGVHLTSAQIDTISKSKELGLFTIISTHSLKEIQKAKRLGADAVTFSPIFYTPNKGEPKGLETLKVIVSNSNIKVIALGGIVTNRDVERIRATKVWGFASIRYFTKETSKIAIINTAKYNNN